MATRRLRLGTRGSALARAQSDLVARALEAAHAGLAVELVIIRTMGDQLQRGPLAPAGGKGLFVKEIEDALVATTIDFAVHSMKDVPAALHDGLAVVAIPAREDPRDVLVAAAPGGLQSLPRGARVGTASVRRRAQLWAQRRDLVIDVLRGNVDTRLRRWRNGEFDAIVLAAAGLARLGLIEPAARPLPPEIMLPAVGQGALALECRANDVETATLLARLDDGPSASAVCAERAFLYGVGGDCNTPLAGHATVTDGRLRLRGQVSDLAGERWLDDTIEGAEADASALGRALAERLLARGAAELVGR